MDIYEEILQKINHNELEQARAMAQSLVDAAPAGADEKALYLLGKIEWKCGNMSAAIGHYSAAVRINPDSEAATALEQARSIMNFYHRDLYNP